MLIFLPYDWELIESPTADAEPVTNKEITKEWKAKSRKLPVYIVSINVLHVKDATNKTKVPRGPLI